MCLQSKWIFPRKATKDIVCYKILTENENEYLETPYQRFPIGTIEELPIIIEGGKHKSIKCSMKNMKYFYGYSKNIVYSIMTELKCKEGGGDIFTLLISYMMLDGLQKLVDLFMEKI